MLGGFMYGFWAKTNRKSGARVLITVFDDVIEENVENFENILFW